MTQIVKMQESLMAELEQVLIIQYKRKICEIFEDFAQKIDINGPKATTVRKKLRSMFDSGTKDRLVWILRNNVREFVLQVSTLLDSVILGKVPAPEPMTVHIYKSKAALKRENNLPADIADHGLDQVLEKLTMEKQIDTGAGLEDEDLAQNGHISALELERKPILNFWDDSFAKNSSFDWKQLELVAAEETSSFHNLQLFRHEDRFTVTCHDLAGPERAILMQVDFQPRLPPEHQVTFVGWTQASFQETLVTHEPEVLSRLRLRSFVFCCLRQHRNSFR